MMNDSASGIAARLLKEWQDFSRTRSPVLPIEGWFFKPFTACVNNRTQVFDTTHYPWSANCKLEIKQANGVENRGSGWLIAPRVVITAGHCVHEGKGGAFHQEIKVIPGLNGTIEPFGHQTSSCFRASEGWISSGVSGVHEQDFGAIILEKPFVSSEGISPGFHYVEVWTDSQIEASELTLSGYPWDTWDIAPDTQWKSSSNVTSVDAQQIVHPADTAGGNSGSALLSEVDQVAIGIHCAGGCPNKGVRITEAVKMVLEQWCGEAGQS